MPVEAIQSHHFYFLQSNSNVTNVSTFEVEATLLPLNLWS